MVNRRRPRALSLTLPSDKQPYFTLGGERYLLRNLSEEGVGLWVPNEKAFGLTPRTKISGDIVIGQTIYPVTLEVVHSTKGFVGLKIVTADPALGSFFRTLLEPSAYAAALRPVSHNGVEDESGYRRFGYEGGLGVALDFWVAKGRDIKSLQVSLLGKWVGRRQFEPAQTGVLPNTPVSAAVSGDTLLLVHDQVDSHFLQTAAQFLASVPPPLPGPLLWHFLESGEQVFISDEVLRKTG